MGNLALAPDNVDKVPRRAEAMPPAAPAAAAALLISPAACVFARDMVVVVVGGADSDRPSARAEGVMAVTAVTGEEGSL